MLTGRDYPQVPKAFLIVLDSQCLYQTDQQGVIDLRKPSHPLSIIGRNPAGCCNTSSLRDRPALLRRHLQRRDYESLSIWRTAMRQLLPAVVLEEAKIRAGAASAVAVVFCYL